MPDAFKLVSAADMHNQEMQQRQVDQEYAALRDQGANGKNAVPPAPGLVERESWMDAQSVERLRLEEDYERESRGDSPPGKNAATSSATPVGKPVVGESESAGEVGRNGGSRSNVGKSKSKSTERDKKDRHHRHHHHQHHTARNKKHVEDESQKGDGEADHSRASATQRGRTESRSTGAKRHGKLPLDKASALKQSRGMDTPIGLSTPSVDQPTIDALPFVPMHPPSAPPDFPGYATQGHNFQFPPQAPRMPMQHFAWGQQAPQGYGNQPETAARFEQGFQVPHAPFAFSPPTMPPNQTPISKEHSAGQPSSFNARAPPAPPIPQGEEYSPRTIPSVFRFPFPPFGPPVGEASQTWGMPAHAAPAAFSEAQWQAPPQPEEFSRVPSGIHTPSGGLPVSPETVKSSKTSNGQAEVAFSHNRGDNGELSVEMKSDDALPGAQETLEGLRARMRRNAEESRLALKCEKEARKTSEERLAALERFVSKPSKKKKVSEPSERCVEGFIDLEVLSCDLYSL